MENERKCLLSINLLVQIIFAFFDIFFGIYVYDISNDLNIIIYYTLINSVFFYTILLILYRFINKKLLSVLYKCSFVMSLIAIALTFTISSTRLYMVFIVQMFLKLTHVCYYLPHEVATMNKNSKNHMKKFLGLSSTLSLIAGFIGPFVSGLIIDYASYYIVFSVLLVLVVIAFILSFYVKIEKDNVAPYGLVKFAKEVRQVKGATAGYLSYMFYNLCNDGIVASFLPILIFLRTGTNFSVGIYSAVASALSGLALIIYCYFSKNKRLAMWLCTIFQLTTAILIIVWNNLVVFFIYYFVKKITAKILHNGTNESVFTILHNTPLEPYKTENYYTYNFYHHIGIIIACGISLLVYNLANNIISIAILLAAFSLTQIISTILLNKSDKCTEDHKCKIDMPNVTKC